MISIAEAHEINTFLDTVFKFKVNDFVQTAALGEYVEYADGISRHSNDGGKMWDFSLSFSDTIRYQVVERQLQQCHGGVQRHYVVRGINKNGLIERQGFLFTEDELVLSAPFKCGKGMSEDDILKYVDDQKKKDRPS